VTRATSTADGVDLEVALPDGKTEKIHADYLLVATGRGPVTEALAQPRPAFNSTAATSSWTSSTGRPCPGSPPWAT